MQQRTKRFDFNPFLLAITLVLVLKYCENRLFPSTEITTGSLRGQYVLPPVRESEPRSVAAPNYSPPRPPNPSMSDEERLGRINDILKDMGHKPVGSSSNPTDNQDEKPKEGDPKERDTREDRESKVGSSDRRTTRRLDALGYVINEPNTQRDMYCLQPGGCPTQQREGEETIILETVDEVYSEDLLPEE